MKKKLSLLQVAMVLGVGILALRFIPVANPELPREKKTVECRSGSSTKGEYSCAALAAINESYVSQVKPIFVAKCMACHGQQEKVPLYVVVPGVRDLMAENRRHGLKFLDMTHDFPFQSHKGLADALDEIEIVVTHGEMPPVSYMLMHWLSRLNEKEKAVVNGWVAESLSKLEQAE